MLGEGAGALPASNWRHSSDALVVVAGTARTVGAVRAARMMREVSILVSKPGRQNSGRCKEEITREEKYLYSLGLLIPLKLCFGQICRIKHCLLKCSNRKYSGCGG